jgi:hypothetical protein
LGNIPFGKQVLNFGVSTAQSRTSKLLLSSRILVLVVGMEHGSVKAEPVWLVPKLKIPCSEKGQNENATMVEINVSQGYLGCQFIVPPLSFFQYKMAPVI